MYICHILLKSMGLSKLKDKSIIDEIRMDVIYFAVHEGAHLLYALSIGAFRQINFMGIGMQIGMEA